MQTNSIESSINVNSVSDTNLVINDIENFYKNLESLNYKPIMKINKNVGPTVIINIWLAGISFLNIELYYANNNISPVYIIGNNIRIELLNFNANTINSILSAHTCFKLINKLFVSIVVTGKGVNDCTYGCDASEYTDYQAVEFDITYQTQVMSLVMQKDNSGNLTIFKMTGKKKLYPLKNIMEHPIFNPLNLSDSGKYFYKSKSETHSKLVEIMNQRYLSMNSNKDYEDQMLMLINIISSVVTNKQGKKVNINEIVMGNMYYLNIKFNERIYHIVFEPSYNSQLLAYINDHGFIINLNTLKLNETHKLLYDLITIVDLKNTVNPEVPSGEREYAEYKKQLDANSDTFDEIYQESWLEYLLKPFKFNFFN